MSSKNNYVSPIDVKPVESSNHKITENTQTILNIK